MESASVNMDVCMHEKDKKLESRMYFSNYFVINVQTIFINIFLTVLIEGLLYQLITPQPPI